MSKLKSTSQILKSLKTITEPIFYITNDVTKGLGLEKLLPSYHLVCIDGHPLVDYLLEAGVNVFCLEREVGKKNIIFRSSGKLLEHPLVSEYIKAQAGRRPPWIMFFKPSARIDHLCQKRRYHKIGNDIQLNRVFEDKISFYEFCCKLGLPVPLGEITGFGQTDFSVLKKKYGKRLVIQFGRGWAGSSTYFVDNKKEFDRLRKKIGDRTVRICKHIQGKTVLNNCCVTRDEILVGPPAEQITAIAGFTAQKGGTCGRVWPAEIDDKRYEDIKILSEKIGDGMRKEGYLGYFGLDFLICQKTGKIYLSENNARLTASVPFYSKLEIGAGRMPLLAHHVLAFLDKEIGLPACQQGRETEIAGGEIIVRNDQDKPVLIKRDFRPGIYRLNKGRLSFIREAYDIEGIQQKGEFFLIAAAKGRIVNPEMEMVRLDSQENLLGANGQPQKEMIKILLGLKESLMY